MTKIETKIAEKKIESYKEWEATSKFGLVRLASCKSHKASCQRFLEFLEEMVEPHTNCASCLHPLCFTIRDMKKKITDLRNAIKKYDEAGI